MNLAQSNSISHQAPDLGVDTNASIIGKEIGNDGLLRILNTENLHLSNEVLMYAEKGDLASIQRLHKAGKDVVHCKGLGGYTPLHHACNRGHALVAAELLRLNAAIDSKNDNGETPLHLAVYAGNILIVDQLLDFGADINAVNKEGETCLFYAARKAQPAIIRLLLQRGVDATLRDELGDLAEEQAADKSSQKAFQSHLIVESFSFHPLQYSDLLRVLSYLNVNDTLRFACVCSKWHRVSSYEEVWQRLGVRRWELALQSSLGFAPTATMSFYRPSRRSSKDATSSSKGGSAKAPTVGNSSIFLSSSTNDLF
jgi:hypothetical protein